MLSLERYRSYCLSKKGTSEHLPFDDDILVFKVLNKMFALSSLAGWEADTPTCNLKCDPERAVSLRNDYEGIIEGYHMSKKHWNTIKINEDVEEKLLFELIDHSYDLVVSKMTKKERFLLSAD